VERTAKKDKRAKKKSWTVTFSGKKKLGWYGPPERAQRSQFSREENGGFSLSWGGLKNRLVWEEEHGSWKRKPNRPQKEGVLVAEHNH